MITKKFIRPDLILILIFLLIFGLEIYLLYSRVYVNLSTEVNEAPTDNIVRLDLASYSKTLILLDASKTFAPQPLNLANPNPF